MPRSRVGYRVKHLPILDEEDVVRAYGTVPQTVPALVSDKLTAPFRGGSEKAISDSSSAVAADALGARWKVTHDFSATHTRWR